MGGAVSFLALWSVILRAVGGTRCVTQGGRSGVTGPPEVRQLYQPGNDGVKELHLGPRENGILPAEREGTVSEHGTGWSLAGVVDGTPSRWSLGDGPHRIGRGSESEVRLADRSVSREHAVIVIDGGRAEVRDLGSRNGTWVNGRRIEGSAVVQAGDALRFGSIELLLEGGAAAGPVRREVALSLSEAHQLHTTTRLSWKDIQREGVAATPADRRFLQVLTEAGQLLVLPRPLESMLETVLDLVDRVVTAQRTMILLAEDDGEEPVLRAARPPGTLARERLMLSRTLIRTVMDERTSLLVTDAQSDPRFREHASIIALKVHSALVAPLFDNERVIGILYADTTDPAARYDEDQLRTFTALANLAAVKITNARLLAHQREMERLEQELATAATIQRSLLPEALPGHPAYELAARQVPCNEVGGDLYDAVRLDDGRILFLVGDVSGKGMGAALLMSHVIASLRVLYGEDLPLASLVQRVHRQLVRASDSMRFVTLFVARLDPATNRLEFVNGGHNPPLLVCPEGEIRRLEATGTPLGLIEGATYEPGALEMPPGSVLCVYSDGIVEAARGSEFFEEERLIESLERRRGAPLDEVAGGVLDDVGAFLEGGAAGGDVTLLLLRRRGES